MFMLKNFLITCLISFICLGQVVNIKAESILSSQSQDNYFSEIAYYTGNQLKNIEPYNVETEDSVLIGVIEKTVYVSEKKDNDGHIIDSHLMNEDEVIEYKKMLLTRDSSHLGNDSTSRGRLTIIIQLFREGNEYRAYGNAKWAIGAGTAEQGPASGRDFVALTWGGNNHLVQTSKSLSITRHNGTSMSYSQAKADSYKGYCWSFDESTNSGSMESLQAIVKIKRVSSNLKNKQTSMKFTYIHTYQSTTGSISFSGGSAGLAAGVTLSSTSKKWQIEVDVPGIVY